MKKQIYILFLFLSFVSFSQETNSYSVNYKSWSVDVFLTSQLNYQPAIGGIIPFYGLGIYPRYNFFAPEDYFSLGIGFPVNLGIEGYGSQGVSHFQFFADTPLELTLNIGDKATQFSEYYFGCYFGGGISYNCSLYNNSVNNLKNVSNSLGPILSFGFKYRYMERPIGIRASYMWGLINDFKKDPTIIYQNDSNYPKILNLSITYGVL